MYLIKVQLCPRENILQGICMKLCKEITIDVTDKLRVYLVTTVLMLHMSVQVTIPIVYGLPLSWPVQYPTLHVLHCMALSLEVKMGITVPPQNWRFIIENQRE